MIWVMIHDQGHSNHGTSKEPPYSFWKSMCRFLWYTMIRVIVDNKSQRNTLFYNPVIFRRLKVKANKGSRMDWRNKVAKTTVNCCSHCRDNTSDFGRVHLGWSGSWFMIKVTRIMVHQRNRCFPSGKVCVVSSDTPWSDWSWIINPNGTSHFATPWKANLSRHLF